MYIYLKINDKQIIADVKFETYGCGSAITCGPIATELIECQPLSETLKLTNKAVTEALGGLPAHILHSVFDEEAVRAAVNDHYDKNEIDHIRQTFLGKQITLIATMITRSRLQ